MPSYSDVSLGSVRQSYLIEVERVTPREEKSFHYLNTSQNGCFQRHSDKTVTHVGITL